MKNKAIVIYNSQTGFTKKYANWIRESIGCDCMELSRAKKVNLGSYDIIIFGGWACAGTVSKLRWFKDNMKKWANKKLAVYCVGGSPIENPDIEIAMRGWFTEEEHEKVSLFYCPGGFNYDKMPAPSRLMMKMFVKTLKAKKDKTEAEEIMAEMVSKSYDISDKKYIVPIVEWANNAGV